LENEEYIEYKDKADRGGGSGCCIIL